MTKDFLKNLYGYSQIKEELFSNPSLKKISREYIGEKGNFGISSLKGGEYTAVKYDEIPFLLDKIYSLDNM